MNLLPKTPSTHGPAELFTGDVWFDVIAAGVAPSRLRVNLVRFAPAAHTAWHRHANGQTLHVVDGIGLVGTRDGHVIVMRAGDTVHTPPGEWHWHGAAPDHAMAHLAMWESLAPDQDGPETEWADHLSDTEYPGTSLDGGRTSP
jgi:quercetin dioxygenase-like cupin family protein